MTEGRARISRKERRAREKRAEREAAWFYGKLGGRVPEAGPAREAAITLHGWLQSTTAFHRGALSLWHAKKGWPAPIRGRFGEASSLVVRLECVLHPAVGRPVDELEGEAAGRLCELIAECEREPHEPKKPLSKAALHLHGLEDRADRHFQLAVRALAKARGSAPCVLRGIEGGS